MNCAELVNRSRSESVAIRGREDQDAAQMNRRAFISMLMAVPAASALPWVQPPRPLAVLMVAKNRTPDYDSVLVGWGGGDDGWRCHCRHRDVYDYFPAWSEAHLNSLRLARYNGTLGSYPVSHGRQT